MASPRPPNNTAESAWRSSFCTLPFLCYFVASDHGTPETIARIIPPFFSSRHSVLFPPFNHPFQRVSAGFPTAIWFRNRFCITPVDARDIPCLPHPTPPPNCPPPEVMFFHLEGTCRCFPRQRIWQDSNSFFIINSLPPLRNAFSAPPGASGHPFTRLFFMEYSIHHRFQGLLPHFLFADLVDKHLRDSFDLFRRRLLRPSGCVISCSAYISVTTWVRFVPVGRPLPLRESEEVFNPVAAFELFFRVEGWLML